MIYGLRSAHLLDDAQFKHGTQDDKASQAKPQREGNQALLSNPCFQQTSGLGSFVMYLYHPSTPHSAPHRNAVTRMGRWRKISRGTCQVLGLFGSEKDVWTCRVCTACSLCACPCRLLHHGADRSWPLTLKTRPNEGRFFHPW